MSLNNSLKAVSGQVGQLEAREQELVTLLNLKVFLSVSLKGTPSAMD